jgi:hypothetical protein
MRPVERVHIGRASAMSQRLRTVSERHGYARRDRRELRAGVEELMVTAPFHVRDKQAPHFEQEPHTATAGRDVLWVPARLTATHQERHIDYAKQR